MGDLRSRVGLDFITASSRKNMGANDATSESRVPLRAVTRKLGLEDQQYDVRG